VTEWKFRVGEIIEGDPFGDGHSGIYFVIGHKGGTAWIMPDGTCAYCEQAMYKLVRCRFMGWEPINVESAECERHFTSTGEFARRETA
jgi:hypothetical protein